MANPPVTMPARQAGSARRLFIRLVVAASIFVALAARLYADGASDLGFIVVMSIGAVLVIAFLSPRRFTSMRGADPDWEDENPYGPAPEDNEAEHGRRPSQAASPRAGSKDDAP